MIILYPCSIIKNLFLLFSETCIYIFKLFINIVQGLFIIKVLISRGPDFITNLQFKFILDIVSIIELNKITKRSFWTEVRLFIP